MLNKIRHFIIIFGIIILASSCGSEGNNKLNIDTSGITIEPLKVKRYEKALFSLNPNALKQELKTIAPEFPVFLNVDLDDTLNLIQLHDFITSPLNIKLYDETIQQYPSVDFLEMELELAFKHFKYYFPENDLPKVFTYVSGLLYDYPVQFFGNNMVIALDMYLGEAKEEYRRIGLPLYKIEKMDRSHILRDCMNELYFYSFPYNQGKTVLDRMISEGKRLYFLDAMLSGTPDAIKIGYPEKKLRWCIDNEVNIWAFMIENQLLFSSDVLTLRKFFADGPYSNSFSTDSPARIGEWTGWQIIKAFMDNNPEVTLPELFAEQESQKILNLSKYKPGK